MDSKLNNNIIESAVEGLLADHLFNPTDKSQWVTKLINDGLSEEESKRAYKIASAKYHFSRVKKEKKLSGIDILKNIAKGIVGGTLTFVIAPYVYIIFVLIVIAILGYIFNF